MLQQLCVAQLQKNLCFGMMVSQEVKDQMDTLCPFNVKNSQLLLGRSAPEHLAYLKHFTGNLSNSTLNDPTCTFKLFKSYG